MEVKIYKPPKNSMQSGRKSKAWVLEFPKKQPVSRDFLMGWAGHGDTMQQLTLSFPDQESAIAYAEHNGFAYYVESANERNIKPKAYSDNFAHHRKMPWTH
ncbi:MAG: ETC complex I subunit [Pseudomonadota bacterium]